MFNNVENKKSYKTDERWSNGAAGYSVTVWTIEILFFVE